MSLSTITSAPLDYEGDIRITPTTNGEFAASIFGQGMWHSFDMAMGKGASGINDYCIWQGYRCVDKRTEEVPFEAVWDYRYRAPSWPIFLAWLKTYYTYKHREEQQNMLTYADSVSHAVRDFYVSAKARDDAFVAILHQLESGPASVRDMLSWIKEQIQVYNTHEGRLTRYVLKHFAECLGEYVDNNGEQS